MKRLTSLLLIIIIITGLCPSVVIATPPASDVLDDWILIDGGSNIYVNIVQYPKVGISTAESGDVKHAANSMELQEVILEMDLSLSQKYFQSFKSGGTISELELNALNPQDRAIFKIKLENCTVCGYSVRNLFLNWAPAPVKAVIKLKAEKITSESVIPSGPAVQIPSAKKMDTSKVFINGTEYIGYAAFSEIEGYSVMNGRTIYNNFELFIQHSATGTLPDWLSSFDGKTDYTTNPQCKLRYELSTRQGDEKLAFEVQLNTTGQEFAEDNGIKKLLSKYTFRVFDINFVSDSTAAVDPVPATPARVLITDSNLRRAQEYSWSGNWVTTFGKMTLKQDGTKVTGEYGNPIETLEGTVSGNKLTGTWHDSLSSGKFEFTMSDDGKSFKGTMYSQTLGDRGTFQWNGDRE